MPERIATIMAVAYTMNMAARELLAASSSATPQNGMAAV
jgi:hypothetical protein